MAEKNYSASGKPNTTIAGGKGAKNSTGDQSMGVGMPANAGTFAPHYGPGGAGGKGKAPMEKPLKDQEKEPGGKAVKVNAPQGMPATAGTFEDDYNGEPVDQEKQPGKGARGGKKGKKTFRSIADLRAEVKRRGLG